MLPLRAEYHKKLSITSMLRSVERATAEHLIRSERRFLSLKRIKDSILGEVHG
jgi:hypothetical protein